jgi:hypothetical protein
MSTTDEIARAAIPAIGALSAQAVARLSSQAFGFSIPSKADEAYRIVKRADQAALLLEARIRNSFESA